jgi:hypothetical protein
VSEDRSPEDTRQGEPGPQWTLEDGDKAREKFNYARIEFAKLHYDWLKHLTTLCTGSILVISALSGSVFSDSSVLWRWLIPGSLVLLLLAVILLGYSMWYWLNYAERACVFWYLHAEEDHEFATSLEKVEAVSWQQESISSRLASVGSICFALGIAGFCAFVLLNTSAFF